MILPSFPFFSKSQFFDSRFYLRLGGCSSCSRQEIEVEKAIFSPCLYR